MKKGFTYLFLTGLLLSFPVLNSCTDKAANKDEVAAEQDTEGIDDSRISLSQEQFTTASMKIGNPAIMPFQQIVKANGYVEASAQGRVQISSFISGKVKDIALSPGQKVKKGQRLFSIESNEIIELQQEYAEVYSGMMLAESNLQRQRILAEENIAAKKDLQKAESEYNTIHAKSEGLKARLKLLNINAKEVESGKIVSQISFFAPIPGVVSSLQLVNGQFIDPNTVVLELVNPDQLQLSIFVFKQDIQFLAEGQQVNYYDPDHKELRYKASLKHIGKTVDNTTKTVQCIAKISGAQQGMFVSGSFVESEIITCERSAMALPKSALIEEDNRYYVLVKVEENNENLIFQKIPVEIGVIQQDQAELLSEGLENILIEGAYNLTGE